MISDPRNRTPRKPLGRRAALGGGLAGVGTLLAAPAQAAAATPAAEGRPLRLSLNENPFGPSPAVTRALEAAVGQVNRYGDQVDADRLLDRISTLERVPREQVVLGDILSPLGLFLAARPPAGGRFVYSSPGYTALVDAGRPLGAIGVGVPLDAALRNDLPGLDRAVSGDTRAIYLVNPHNPSGTGEDPDAFEAFLRSVARRTLAIVDEAYLEYAVTVRSAVPLVRAGHDVAVFRTLDKIYGMAGLPIGYLLAPRPLADALREAGLGDPHDLGRLAVAGAAAALGDQDWVARVRRSVATGRARLTAALDRLGIRHTASQADFVFFRSPIPAAQFRERLSRQGIVAARPFPPLVEWIRISVGTEAEVTRTIAALSAAARSS